MTALIVIASILLGFYLIGCIRPHVIISMEKYMNIYVKVFFIKFRVSTSQKFDPPDEELDLPKKKKKPKKPKPKKPKEKKEKPKKDKKAPKKPNLIGIGIDIPKMLAMLRDVLASLFVKLWRYFRVRVKNFHIVVATDDAAKTAMMYGVICGYGDAIMKILEKALDFKIEKGAKVGAECDFLTEEMKIEMEIDISISIGNVFRYLFGIIGAAVGGALRGIKLKLNKKFFAQNKQYKTDLAEYNEKKSAKDEKAKEKADKKAKKDGEKESEEKLSSESEADESAKNGVEDSGVSEETDQTEETDGNSDDIPETNKEII